MDGRAVVARGGCACGAVRYALLSPPSQPSICHCRMCQKAFGNYMAPLVNVPKADLVWTRAEPGRFRSSTAVERGFCRACGTPLLYDVLDDARISVSIGSLDDPGIAEPAVQFGTDSARPDFERLATLPVRPPVETRDPRFASRMHPDHDTDVWPVP